jgi:hypothetical protein
VRQVFESPRKPKKMEAEVARHCEQGAEQLADYDATISRLGNVLKSFVLETPPNVGSGLFGLWRF